MPWYLTGVDLDADGKPIKWKVENSWGDKVGQKGYFVASDAWMDEYTYQIVVRKDFLTAEELAAYEAEATRYLLLGTQWEPLLQNKRIFQKHWIKFQCF